MAEGGEVTPVVRVVPLEDAMEALEAFEKEFAGHYIFWIRSLGNGSVALCAADSERAAKAALVEVARGGGDDERCI